MAMGLTSVDKINGRLLWKAAVSSYAPAMPFKASNWPTLSKAPGFDNSVSWVLKDICLFFEHP